MFTFLLAKYIDKSKYGVTVAIPTPGQLGDLLEKNDIEYFVFNNKKNEGYNVNGIIDLFFNIKKNKYDIIHAQAGVAPCLIGKIVGTKLILEHRHGLDFTIEQINKMNLYRLTYEKLKKYLVDLTLTGCKSDKDILVKRFKFLPERVEVVYNGLESNKNISIKKTDGNFIIGTIGRLTYQKNQEYFIEMAKKLCCYKNNFEFHIYGEGEKHNDYSNLIEKYNLREKVFLKGYTTEVSKVMRTFNLFVLTSRYEGIPYVILEAMKAGVPVISTDVGGINEIIINMENGILVQKENATELIEKVKLLYHSKEIRDRLSKKAEKDFEENYTIKKTVSAVEEIYAKII